MSQENLLAPINVLLLEDQATTRKILCAAIEADPELRLMASFDTLKAGLDWLEISAPDVLLVDLMLKDGLGIEAIRACAQRYPDCSIMVLTGSSDDADVDACIQAGALGYLLKEGSLHLVARAIKDLHLGGSPISPAIVRRLLVQSGKGDHVKVPALAGTPDHEGDFTKRELAVLHSLANGLSYDEIAGNLSISVLTVQNYIKRLYRKLAVRSRGKAVVEAQKRGLLH